MRRERFRAAAAAAAIVVVASGTTGWEKLTPFETFVQTVFLWVITMSIMFWPFLAIGGILLLILGMSWIDRRGRPGPAATKAAAGPAANPRDLPDEIRRNRSRRA